MRWYLAQRLCCLFLCLPVLAGVLVARGGATLFGASAPMNVYFVDQVHPDASDSNPGTEEAPWLTIQHAAEVASAGDTVLVKAGVYRERVVPQNPGLPGSMVTFKAEPRRSVTMYGFYTLNADYVRIEGFNITTDASLTGWTERYGVFIRSNHVEVVDNYLFDMSDAAIQGYWHEPYPRAAYVAQNNVYRSQKGIGVTGYDWVVEDNEVERLYDHGGGDCDYSRFFGDDHLIRGNYFHGTQFDEIGDAHVDCFQTFDNNGEFGHNITIDGNLCTDFHQGFMGEAHYYHDISHITFKNNVFAHGGAWGLAVEDISYLTAVNNTFVDIRHHGIGLSGGYAHHALIKNNIFYDTGTSYWFPEGSNSIGDHNLIFGSRVPPVAGDHDLVGVDPLFMDVDGGNYHLQANSPAVDAGEGLASVGADFDGVTRPQGSTWDIGAFEFAPALRVHAAPRDREALLSWRVNATVPATSTWQINYQSDAGTAHVPISGIPRDTRAYRLTGLSNYVWYTITLSAMIDSTPWLMGSARVMPTDCSLYVPLVSP